MERTPNHLLEQSEDPFLKNFIGKDAKRKFCTDLMAALNQPNFYFSDITLELIDSEPVTFKPVHKILLAAQSVLFKELFTSTEKGKLPQLKVKQLNDYQCNFLLEMVYGARSEKCIDEPTLLELTKKFKLGKIRHYLKGNHIYGPYSYLYSFLNQPKFSDIIIRVIPKEGPIQNIFAHKVILATRSPVLNAMLCGPMSNRNSTELEILDYSYNSVLRYLEFLYTAILVNRSESIEEEAYLKIELLKLSDQYQNFDLKQLCQIQIQPYIEKSNVLEFIQLALYYNGPVLLDSCIQTIAERYSYFSKKQEYIELPQDVRESILKRYQQAYLFSDPKKAPWVEVYLNSPHSSGLKHGQTISDYECSTLGFDPRTQKSIFPSKKKDK